MILRARVASAAGYTPDHRIERFRKVTNVAAGMRGAYMMYATMTSRTRMCDTSIGFSSGDSTCTGSEVERLECETGASKLLERGRGGAGWPGRARAWIVTHITQIGKRGDRRDGHEAVKQQRDSQDAHARSHRHAAVHGQWGVEGEVGNESSERVEAESGGDDGSQEEDWQRTAWEEGGMAADMCRN